ncbi:MAG: DUF4010 domain-containing protein, partial [Lewinellaceae bacterium]|nr:DUF4010 domain-containing protein [Lewinellaceae bacterium]
SSTATTFPVAVKKNTADYPPVLTAAAILIATAMMYLRILLLAFLFNGALGRQLIVPFFLLAITSTGISSYFYYRHLHAGEKIAAPIPVATQNNPLEFRTALVFATLFVIFATLTHYVLTYYGNSGLNALSFIVGVTDIDPFLINLFQGKQVFAQTLVVTATIQATISNNFLKAVYGVSLGTPMLRKYLWMGFGAVILISFTVLFAVKWLLY